MRRALAVLVATSGLSCATPALGPGNISIVEKTHGLYEVSDGRPHHLAQTETVPCELGSTFGAELVIHLGHHKGGALPMQGEWRMPPVPGVREAIQGFPETQPMVDEEATQIHLAAGATLDTPEDLVAGDYVLRFLDPETEHVYYERRFRVDECP